MDYIDIQTHTREELIDITYIIAKYVTESNIKNGIVFCFAPHTTAALTINENADPDVRLDMETALNKIVPEDLPFVHSMEGPDDMPAHVKASFMGASVSVPIRDGHAALGTWQGIYLCEHRNRGGSRRLVVTAFGTPKPSK